MSKKLTITTIALAISLGLAGCGKKTADEYTSSIQKFIAEKNPQSAVIELKSAIQDFPTDQSFRQQLGLLALQYGDMSSAEKELKKAIELGADKNQLAVQLFRAMYNNRNLKDVANLYLDDQAISDDTQLYLAVFRIMSDISSDNTDGLRTKLDKLVSAENHPDLMAFGQAQLQILGGNPKEAFEAASKVSQESPIYPEAIYLKARLQHGLGDFKGSLVSFNEAEKLLPNNFVLQLLKSQMLVDSGDNKAAKESISTLQKISPDHPLVNYLSAIIAYDEKDFTNAKNYVEKAISYGVTDPATRILAGLCNLNLNLTAQALAHFDAAKDLVKKSEELSRVYNALLLKSGRSSEVQTQLASSEAADPQMLAATAYQLIREGSMDSARQLVAQTPTNKKASVQDVAALAALKLGFEQTEQQGMQELEDILKADPGQEAARAVLAQSYLRQKQFAKAEALADEWLKDPAKAVTGYNLKAYSRLLQGKVAEAKVQLDEAQKAEANNSFTLIQQAGIALQENNPTQGQQLLETILDKDPAYVPAIVQYYSLLKLQKKSDAALLKLQQIVASHPELPATRAAVASILMRESQPEKVIELLTADKSAKTMPVEYKNLLVEAYARVGKNDDMLRISESQWKENPEDLTAALLHAKALTSAKNYDQAEALLNKLLEKRAGNQQIIETLFMIKLQQEDAAAALKLLEQIKPVAGQEQQYLFMKGRLQFQTKQLDAAITSLQASYAKQPLPSTALLLAEVLTNAKKKEQALSLLKEHNTKYPGNSKITTVYANLVSESEPKEAARIYQEYLNSGQKNLMILNNYAWILFQDGKFEDAKKYAEQAVELDGRNPDVLDTLGSILLAKGEVDAAILQFEKSLSLRPEFAEVQLHLVAALIKANRKVDAQKLLETIKTTESRLQKEMATLKSQL